MEHLSNKSFLPQYRIKYAGMRAFPTHTHCILRKTWHACRTATKKSLPPAGGAPRFAAGGREPFGKAGNGERSVCQVTCRFSLGQYAKWLDLIRALTYLLFVFVKGLPLYSPVRVSRNPTTFFTSSGFISRPVW